VLAQSDPGLPGASTSSCTAATGSCYLRAPSPAPSTSTAVDYLLRDAHSTGVEYGMFDLDWPPPQPALRRAAGRRRGPRSRIDGAKGVPAIESFILARLFMFQHVYFHKTSRACEWMVARLLGRVCQLVRRGGTHRAGAARDPHRWPVDGDAPLEEYLELDDNTLWTAIGAFRSAKDPVLSDFATRLYARKLFKTHELYGDARDEANARALPRDRARRSRVRTGSIRITTSARPSRAICRSTTRAIR